MSSEKVFALVHLQNDVYLGLFEDGGIVIGSFYSEHPPILNKQAKQKLVRFLEYIDQEVFKSLSLENMSWALKGFERSLFKESDRT